ncbi:hypothetical protein D9613_003907 [Agrocybe pediades]|uniref:DUF7729 domain-containing protein n=1 Tax=Agrocybe pediades TaxID=84607 RepID=A0A8H4VKS0_9AGAR|nr:hypothetical protein D9613_003907 [Agrocybe pediades]
MLKTLAFASLLTSAAVAQNSSTSANPLIPTGISSSCTTFLNALNSDSGLTGCLSALSKATSAFAPGSSTTPSSAAVSSALDNLCDDSVTNSCSDSVVRSQITQFYAACPDELVKNPVDSVVSIYDVLYTLTPLRQSVCSKDDSDSWCVMAPSTTSREVSESVGSSGLSTTELLALLYTDNSALKRRAEVPAIVPNITTYHDTNLPFLFLKPDIDATALCTTCTRLVITNYVKFESDTPYAPGLTNSKLLDTQQPLYDAITQKCPADFLNGAVQAAGGLGKSGGLFSGATSAISSEYQAVLAIAMGVTTLAVSFGF